MEKYLRVVIMSGCMLFSCAQAFIYEVVVLAGVSPKSGKKQHFIGLSDFHDKQHAANPGQLLCIEQLLGRQNRDTAKIIIEDLSSGPNGCDHGACGQFQINSRGGILGGLARTCHAKGLPVDNIEYRYCRVAALGPVLNNNQQELREFPSTCGVMVRDIAHEIHAVMQDITSHTGSDMLAVCRDKVLCEVQPQIRELSLVRESPDSVADYLHNRSKRTTRVALLKRLLTFDSALLDLKLAHSVMTADHCDKIIALAGGSHIMRVKEMLLNAGYTLEYQTDVALHKEYDLSRCIGSVIVNGAFCVRPEPIDLEILNRFL